MIAELVDTGRGGGGGEMINGEGHVTGGTLTMSRGTGARSSSQRAPPALHIAARKDDVNGATALLQNVVSTGQPAEVHTRAWLLHHLP